MGHYHLWYLYMIIGLYLITPFLKLFVQKEHKKLILFFVFVSIIIQFTLPVLNQIAIFYEDITFLLVFIEKFHLDFFGGYTTYYLLGWYIVHIGIGKKSVQYFLYLAGISSVLITFFSVYFTQDYENGYSDLNIFILLYSVSVFLALTKLCKCRFKTIGQRRLKFFSNMSFGMYIVHPIVLELFQRTIVYYNYPLLYILVCFCIVLIGSFVLCYICSKVPIARKIIRM